MQWPKQNGDVLWLLLLLLLLVACYLNLRGEGCSNICMYVCMHVCMYTSSK